MLLKAKDFATVGSHALEDTITIKKSVVVNADFCVILGKILSIDVDVLAHGNKFKTFDCGDAVSLSWSVSKSDSHGYLVNARCCGEVARFHVWRNIAILSLILAINQHLPR